MHKIRPATRNSILLGSLCCLSYLAVYIARNVLSAVTPSLIADGIFTEAQIGNLSSVFFVAYAIGQLINGIAGDRIKAKYMISSGLILSGIASIAFVHLASSTWGALAAYTVVGFSLSMIFAPMTKLIAENTEPNHAERCSLSLTFVSFLGSPIAGLLAGFFAWSGVFHVSNGILLLMGVVCFIVLIIFEKKKIVLYGEYKPAVTEQKGSSIKILLEHKIIKFSVISIVTGIVRTTVVFWLPTYISQYLNFSPSDAAFLFTVSTLVISFSAIVGMGLYEMLNRNMNTVLLISFSTAALSFLAAFLIQSPVLNIIFMMLAILASNSATTILWSVYCPSLKETGMVSSATGFLDFLSYMAAAVSSVVFANAVTVIGWNWLIIIWFGLMVIGVFISLPGKKAKI